MEVDNAYIREALKESAGQPSESLGVVSLHVAKVVVRSNYGGHYDAEELLSHCSLKVLEVLLQGKVDASQNIFSYLYQVALNAAKRHLSGNAQRDEAVRAYKVLGVAEDYFDNVNGSQTQLDNYLSYSKTWVENYVDTRGQEQGPVKRLRERQVKLYNFLAANPNSTWDDVCRRLECDERRLKFSLQRLNKALRASGRKPLKVKRRSPSSPRTEESKRRVSEKQKGEKGHNWNHNVKMEELQAMYDSGMSIRKLAKHFGIGSTTVHRRLVVHGDGARTPWQSRNLKQHRR